jgi:hypothetical protein
MTKEKKAQLLKEFIETTNDYSVGADQEEFCNFVSKEVKLSGQSASSQRKKWTHAYMLGEKLTLLHVDFISTTNKTGDESR